MGDLFVEKNVSPMLVAENVQVFADEKYLYELKWDGERCIAFLDPKHGTDLRNKRNVRMLSKVLELSMLHQRAGKRCVLDGELLCLVDNKPSFPDIQRRSMMSDRYKIELEMKLHPASFIAFDCLYYDGEDLMSLPLAERKEYLRQAVTDSAQMAVSRIFEADYALNLFQLTQEQGLEGIVAKKKDSLYFPGKRTKSWLKMKHMMDDDFVVCGYIRKANRMVSLVLGQYCGEELVYKGHVTLGVGGIAFAQIQAQPTVSELRFTNPSPEDERTVWLNPVLVCTVQFMHHTKNGGMRQPVFKGLRMDKLPNECKTADKP